jgi:hypothetical protein
LFPWNVAGRRHRLWNAAYLGEARHYLGIDEDRIEDPRWRITCIPERVPLVAGFENQIRVANFSRKQSRPGDVRARRNERDAMLCSPAFATKSNRRFPTNFRSLPPFDIASAPLTYVAAHTAHLATKVE